MKIELQCIIKGKVQDVMFRDFAQRKARSLDIVGIVKNQPDGSVEIISVGEQEDIQKFLVLLHKGPFLTRIKMRIESVEAKFNEPTKKFNDFIIVY
ncbi:MAG: Acylphosphatase [Parcubacteria group bacterium GW2011_GWF1_40_6]|uniref:acylphosphatase n=2 Tax=Candidatus Nomuraibacteriota TaxID=1752729 RepID=A0A0G0QSZ1_9BACT|nr:MAG: Acylphosphatase [Candidatus Nomurabacteria bacterium GW2011_GWF2_40_12]KKR69738.1 MAG: Acylphosphatase [Parcubacteria group bacterium GW2011_GWF1_40_6]OGJ10061.1 MAG: hypothetical protein A2356_01715 [Candidatus Nomurabacteria bacterium RIFOXYB1_FULL_39_16]OGJ15493.1 MAG: hypothetical protein A2585_01365 [Candidatus Nomurabacteria bacterium RIFOXYD1_FULL_39_12]